MPGQLMFISPSQETQECWNHPHLKTLAGEQNSRSFVFTHCRQAALVLQATTFSTVSKCHNHSPPHVPARQWEDATDKLTYLC